MDSKAWKVYLVKCSDNSLYCGITTNLAKRIRKHNAGVASKYTRSRLPVELVCWSPCRDESTAKTLEAKIKKMKKDKKITCLSNVSGRTGVWGA